MEPRALRRHDAASVSSGHQVPRREGTRRLQKLRRGSGNVVRFYLYEGGLGDSLALTATVREYHKKFPLEPITVSTGRRYDAVFQGNPHLAARPEGGAAVVLAMEKFNDRGNIAVSFGLQAGIEVVDHTPEIFLTGREREEAARIPLPEGRPVLALDPWARSTARRWRWERWEEVVNELAKKYTVVGIGQRVPDYVLGSRDLRRLPVHLDLTGSLRVRQTAALLERADLFIGMDSGGAHLSAAAGCPSVILYSRSAWHSRAYWNTTPVYSPSLPCAAALCNWKCGNPNGFCLDHVQADRVLETIELALRRFPRADQKTDQGLGQAEGGRTAPLEIPGRSGQDLQCHDHDDSELGFPIRRGAGCPGAETCPILAAAGRNGSAAAGAGSGGRAGA